MSRRHQHTSCRDGGNLLLVEGGGTADVGKQQIPDFRRRAPGGGDRLSRGGPPRRAPAPAEPGRDPARHARAGTPRSCCRDRSSPCTDRRCRRRRGGDQAGLCRVRVGPVSDAGRRPEPRRRLLQGAAEPPAQARRDRIGAIDARHRAHGARRQGAGRRGLCRGGAALRPADRSQQPRFAGALPARRGARRQRPDRQGDGRLQRGDQGRPEVVARLPRPRRAAGGAQARLRPRHRGLRQGAGDRARQCRGAGEPRRRLRPARRPRSRHGRPQPRRGAGARQADRARWRAARSKAGAATSPARRATTRQRSSSIRATPPP